MSTITPGPWAWFGTGNNQNLYLATTHSGRRYVMGFERWGMRGAQPIFQPNRGGSISMKSTGGYDLRKLFPAGIFPENEAKPEGADVQQKDGGNG